MLPILILLLLANLALGLVCYRLWRGRRLAEPRLSSAFRDAAGRLWTLRVDVECLRRVRAMTGVDLLELVGAGTQAQKSIGSAIAALVDDPVLLVDVLYVVCKPEADARGVSDEDFGRAMAGDAIGQAVEALLAGVIDFFPSAAQRARLRRMAATMLRMMSRADQGIEQMMTPEATEQILRRALGPSTSATSSPESAASTPED